MWSLNLTIYHVINIGENYFRGDKGGKKELPTCLSPPWFNKVSASWAHCGFLELHSCCTAASNLDRCWSLAKMKWRIQENGKLVPSHWGRLGWILPHGRPGAHGRTGPQKEKKKSSNNRVWNRCISKFARELLCFSSFILLQGARFPLEDFGLEACWGLKGASKTALSCRLPPRLD